MKIFIRKTQSSSMESVVTHDKWFGSGGQARIYKFITKGYEEYCLKMYTKDEDAKKSYDRIVYMIQHPPRNIMSSNSYRICWPTALAYDENKNFIGYVMPLAFDESRDLKILEVYNAKPISQQAKYKKYPAWFDKYELDNSEGLRNRIKMLCNWAIAIYSIHETNKYVIVDLKPENVLATASGKISIVDTDSFQISDNGKILFPGVVYTPGYFPPEGKQIKERNMPFTIECDCFAAAICFYKILTGVHPYGGTIKQPPYNQFTSEEEFISQGLFAFGSNSRYLTFPSKMNLHKHFDNLPTSLQELFKRAFGNQPADRPKLDEWGKALHDAAVSSSIVVKSHVKPDQINALTIQITDVQFCDSDYDGNIIRNQGSPLYTDVTYLTPVITYSIQKRCPSLELFYKIYSPSGQLNQGASSKPGYSASAVIDCSIPSPATALLPGWGNNNQTVYAEAGKWIVEFYEGDKCLYKSSVNILPKQQVSKKGPDKKKWGWLWWLLLPLALWAGYQFWYKDYSADKKAPRVYSIAENLVLRSSQNADTDNRIGTVGYGTRMLQYLNENGWACVKANGKKGYVASGYLITENDYVLLTGLWGNEEAKEMVSTAKCRHALLDCVKKYNLSTGSEGWQLFTLQKEIKPNSVSYPQLDNGMSYFTEFAFILENKITHERQFYMYAFEKDERPLLIYSEPAPETGHIQSVTYNQRTNKYRVTYTKKRQGYQPPAIPARPVAAEQPNAKDIMLTTMVFADVDYDHNIRTGFGEQLYTDMEYLRPKVSYAKPNGKPEKYTLRVKLYKPDKSLERGSSSPDGCTFEQTVTLTDKEGAFLLLGWGRKGGGSFVLGSYQYEIWYKDNCLISVPVSISERQTVQPAPVMDDKVYDAVEKMPEFPGGTDRLMKYISNNLKYPTIDQERGTQGKVIVQFVVDKGGNISQAKVLRSVSPTLDQEAVRVIMGMPKWKPGKHEGRAVSVKFTLPITFKLN